MNGTRMLAPGGDDHRRETPDEAGALCCLGFCWEDIVKALYESGRALKAAPELKKRSIIWVLRARINGVRIEFYEDDEAFFRRLKEKEKFVDGINGPQVHAGRITWI